MSGRNIVDVINRLSLVVPGSDEHASTIKRLLNLRRNVMATAPEMMFTRWAELQEIMVSAITDPLSKDWMVYFVAFVADKEPAEIAAVIASDEVAARFL